MDQDLKEMFEGVDVEKLTYITQSETLYVDIISTHLIDLDSIKKAEELIRLFVFEEEDDDHYRKVKIKAKYHLSEQYDPEYIMRVHGDGILEGNERGSSCRVYTGKERRS